MCIRYLSWLWVPSLLSLSIYMIYRQHMPAVSVFEPIAPIISYSLVGLIVSTVSGFEHKGLVMRRKYLLTGEGKSEDLRAIYAFR